MAGKTTFVVGAGASSDFGMPLGAGLVEQIRVQLFGEVTGNSTDRHVMDCAMESGLTGDFGVAARDVAGGMLASRSIDRFLESRSDDPLVIMMGKCAIAYCLLESEWKSNIGGRADGDWNDIHNSMAGATGGSWIGKLFSILQEGVNPKNSSEIFNNIDFVTFNYDRCIERYIRLAFNHIMGLAAEDAEILAQAVEIRHVYGSLGQLHPGIDFRNFGASPHDCLSASRLLRTFSEGCEDGELAGIREKIYDSDTIIILGFAFDRMNVDAIFPERLSDKVKVFATTHGVDIYSLEYAREKIGGGDFFERNAYCQNFCSSVEFRTLFAK